MIGYYDNPIDHEGEKQAKVYEGVEKEVSKMSLRDVLWEITELLSNQKLWGEVWTLIETTWRKEGINNTIDTLLDELFCTDTDLKNIVIFVRCLDLEKKIREMLTERMFERAMEGVE